MFRRLLRNLLHVVVVVILLLLIGLIHLDISQTDTARASDILSLHLDNEHKFIPSKMRERDDIYPFSLEVVFQLPQTIIFTATVQERDLRQHLLQINLRLLCAFT